MADEKFGRYSPITSEPVLTAEEIAKRNLARILQKQRDEEELKRRQERLRADALQQAKDKANPDEQDRRRPAPLQRREDGEWRRESTAPEKPTTVTRDNVTVPLEQAVSEIPAKMRLEQRLLSSPLKERALRRNRTEELIGQGKTPDEAAQQAQKEQENRQAAFERGKARAQARDGKGASGFVGKEASDLATDLVYGGAGLISRAVGANQAADEFQAFVEGSHAETADWRNEKSPYPQVQGAVSGAANSLVQMVPGMAASAVAGPGVGMGVMAAQFGGQEYNRAMYEGAEAGIAGDELNRYAMVQGGIEASIMPIMNKIPGLAGLEGKVLRQSIARGVANNPKVRQAIASGVVNFTKESAAEVTEEVITEALHGFASEKLLNEKQDYGAIFKDTVLQTLLTMGLTEGGQRAAGMIGGRSTPEPSAPAAGTVAPSTPTEDPATPAAEGTPVTSPEPVPNHPAIEAFLKDPSSARKYESAVKAGLPSIEKPNRDNRAKYADDIRKQRQADPVPQLAAPLEPSAVDRESIETPSGTVPDGMQEWMNALERGNSNGQETNVNQEQQGPEDAQGRQEGLLTREQFYQAYRDTLAEIDGYSLDQDIDVPRIGPSLLDLTERLVAMADAHPDWANEIENATAQEATPVATGGPEQDQSQPTSEAGPVSKPAESLRESLNSPGTSSDITRLGVLARVQNAKTYDEAESAFGDLTFEDMQQFRLQPKDVLFYNNNISDADKSRLQAKYETPVVVPAQSAKEAGPVSKPEPAARPETPDKTTESLRKSLNSPGVSSDMTRLGVLAQAQSANTYEEAEAAFGDLTFADMQQFRLQPKDVLFHNFKISDADKSRLQAKYESPAGTQVLAPPADSQSPAAHTRESFESEYRNNADQMMALPPDDPAREAIRERQSALYEAHPDWADEIHNNPTPSPVVGPGEAGPDQSSVPATGPVSSEPAENQTSPVSSEPDAIQYHSGLSRSPADMDSSIQSGNPVGVSAFSSLSQPVRKRLVDYANNDGKVFVDSGAFTAHRKGKEVDWDRTLFSYHELLSSVAPDKRENVSIVAPDVVGDHDETMRLQWFLRDKFNSIIELGGKVILPVQKDKDKSGGGSLFANWADATDTFSGEQNEKFIIGVPFNEEAWSQDDVLNFMKERQKDVYRGSGLRPFHLLGAGPSKVQALFEAAQAEGLSLDGISADAMPKKISQRKRPAKPKEESPQTPADSPVPAFAALPQKSQDLFNKAFESKDVEQLKQMVDKSNVAWNKEFERRTGTKLPKTLKDRRQAVLDWAASQAAPVATEAPEPAKAETPPADSQPELSEVEQATLAELMTLLAPDQTAVKPQKKPRAPKAAAGSQPTEKKPRSKVSKKISKAKAESDAEVKALYATFVEDMKSLKITRMAFPGAPPVMNPKAIASAVRLTAGLAKNGILTFAEFASLTIDNIGAELATTLAPYLETAWTMLQRVPGYEGVDAAGRIVDFIGVTNENESTDSPDKSVGRKPRKSRRGMAGEAGSASEDGQTEGPAGQDSNDVPSGTASTEADEPGGTGIESEGTGTEQDSGSEQQPGQKTAKPRSRKSSKKLPRRVEGTGNLRIQPDDVIAPTGVVGKLKANIAAIKLLKTLQAESRNATPDEQRILMQYTGWGSLQNVFDENRGEAFIKQPGLKERYGEWYEKAKLYQKPGATYENVEDIRKRVEAWEKQWGDSYVFLKENLTKEEWNRAAASTLNAHFTSRDVITNGIWGALEQMGVSGGRFLEPSAGIGSLIGLMPEAIANNSDVIAIELDKLTGEMVKQLYPDADVYVTGFEDVPIPVGTIDVAATNVPFHQKGPADAKVRYGRDMNLHNYFIARILDSIRPGGVAAVITTHFTMDANPQDREFLAGKADLVGAIRLPNSAFKANAGTEVTTDILFFRKPDGTPFKGQPWLNMKSVGRYSYMKEGKKGKTTEVFGTISVNEYFHDHPEMVLGTHSMDGEMYSGEGEYTVIPTEGAKLADQLQQAVKMLPAGIADANNSDTELVINSTTGTVGVDGRIEFRGTKLVELSNGEWISPAWLKQAMTMTKDGKPRKLSEETRIKKIAAAVTQGIAYTRVRNAYEIHLANMRNEKTTDEEYLKSQKTLNVAYDAYVEKHGALNDPASSWLENDPGFFFTSGLENEAELIEGDSSYKVYSKADIFTQRTVNADKYPTSADSTAEALKISLAWKGHINLPWMAELTGVDQEDLQDELLESGFVFLDPANSLLEPADTYLAGNVHAKLRAAEQAVKEGDKRFERNVEFLKKVQPAKVMIDAITPSLGAPWVPIRAVQIWLREKIGVPATVRYNERADIWSVDAQVSREAQNEWGTLGMHLSDLLPRVLNNASIRVMKPSPDDHKKSVLDEAQTQATQVKAEKLRESFLAWAKSNEAIIPDIEQAFNEQKNFYVKPKYDGSHMSFPGMSDTWLKMIRPYQKDTIWRAIREGRGMIAHGVGAGKTLELIATAMEMKRLGIAQKPLIVVQNSTLGQFARTFNDVYPSAKVLVATNDDLNPDNRARFMAKIATGNWDSIVMAKSTFNMKVPNDPALEQAMMEGLIDELKQVMLEAELADGKGAPSVKAIQQQINSLQARLEKVIDRANAKTDKDVYFEQMGIDALFLDEAHDYKKPPFVTKIDRSIKGLATDVSQRALSALIKLRFVQDNNRGRNTFMATGTPITNTLGESWLLMNMIAPDVLREFGVETFDRFVATFASISTNLEPNPVGKLQRVTRLAKFKNGHQLAQFIQSGWDVLLGDELHEKIREYGGGKIPKMQGGQEMLHLVDRSPAFEAFGKFFLDVYDAFKALTGDEKRMATWVPLSIYGAAKAAAIDVRLVDPTAPDDPGSKLNKMVEGVYDAWVEGTNVTLMAGDKELTGQNLTQLIFSDTSGRRDMSMLREFAASEGVELAEYEDSGDEGANGASDVDEDRWLYQEIKRKLVAKGIPAEQIQLITDHNSTPEKLLAFQDAVSAGRIRIAIGHSDTLGTGVNVQQRLKDLWELDIPMVPAKREQRIGRIIRSGNMNEEVRVHVMAMQKSLDGTLMAMNLRKAKASVQALSGKAGAEFDDPYSESLMSMADMEAAMNDDPLFYRQKELEHQIRQMRLEVEALDQQRSRERQRLRDNESRIETQKEIIAERTSNADRIDAAFTEKMPFVIEGEPVATLKEADAKLKALFDKESARISRLTQDSQIPAIQSLTSPKADHIIADVEFGPMQFTLVYGERPVVDQDEKGVPFTKWVETSGTIITMNKRIYDSSQATRLTTVVNNVQNWPKTWRSLNNDVAGVITHLESENQKLKDFLGKPSTAQVELDNLESQLSQVSSLMFQRDNPGAIPRNPPGPDTPVTQEQMPAGYELVGPETDWTNGRWFIMAPGGFTVTPGGAATPQDAYAKAQTDSEHGDRFPTIAAPAVTPDPATQPTEAGSAREPVESETEPERLRREADQAQQELQQLRDANARNYDVLGKEWDAIKKGERQGSSIGLPVITKEASFAIAGLAMNSIKIGVKSFEVFVRELRANMAEDMVKGVKPNIIAAWNALRGKYGLDEATETAFDAVIAETGDVDLQQAAEAAAAASTPTPETETPPTGATPDPEPLEPDMEDGPDRLYSTQNAATDAERERLGVAPRQPKERQRNEPLVNLAAAMGKTVQGAKDTDALIAELTVKPRATTPLENHQLNFRYAMLDQKYAAALEERNAARRIGDDVSEAIAERESELYLKEQTDLLELLSGGVSYFLGAGLQARKTLIQRDFSMARSLLEFEAAYGREPNGYERSAMEQQIADLEAAKADLQKIIDEQAASIEDLNAKLKEAHDAAVVAASEAPKVTSARARAQKKVSDAWAGVMATLSSTKMNSQIVPYQDTFAAMVNLAGAYAELGVTTLTEYLDRVRKRMGPAAEPLIPQFTDGWNEYQKKIATDDQEQITGKIDPTDNDSIGRAARELHRMVIQRDGLDASADGRNAAVVAVYDIMKDYVEGITEEEVARAMSGIGVYSELNKDEVEVIRRDQKAQLLLLQQLGDWKKGQAPPATGREMPPVSDEQRELRRAVNEAKKDAGIVTTTEGQLRSALDAAKRMAKNRISDLTKAIETGERIASSRKLLTPDAELTALQAERDALQKLYDEAFGKRELSEEQRINAAEKALDRAISDMESDLASGKLYSDPAKPSVTSPAIEAKRAVLEALKASRDELRLSSGEAQARSDAAYERHLLEKDAELARRIAENDFKPAEKKPARVLTPAMLKAMQAIQKKEEALLKKRREWEFANRHVVYRMWKKYPVQAMGMIRKGLTTIDQSLIGRQGWLLGITHPLIYGKAIRKAFASNMREAKSIFPTEQDIFNTEAALDADENWVRLEKIGKLAVTGVHGGLKKTEENYSDVPAWFDNIPGIGGSERAGSAFINSQRRLVFRELVTQLAKMQGKGESSLSSADLRVIGNMVNVASGRASLGRLENSIQGATMLFFSPRWWASRLQTLVGAPIYSESRWLGGEGASTDVRLLVAKEWAKQMAAQTAIMTLAVSALAAAFGEPGDDEEWDWYANPSNPNFGRLRIGSTYIDMTSGIGAHVALLGRLVTGKQVDRWETKDIDRWRMFLNYGRTKLAPVPGIVADWMDGQSIGQDPFGSYDWATSKVVPLSIQDVVKTVREEGLPLGAIVSTMMFFGLGAQTREAKTRSRADISNEIRAMRKQGKSPEKIQDALQKHLEYTAKLEAREKLRTANPDEKAAIESVVAGESSDALTSAVEKEKYDLTIRALEMLSSEDRTKKKAADEDSSIMTARSLLKEIAPTYSEAQAMFNRAYMAKHGRLTEVVGGRFVPKKGVLAARRRLRAIYAP